MPYIGGFPIYVDRFNNVMDKGFEGFVLDGGEARNAPPKIRNTERWHVPLNMDIISPAAIAAKRVPIV
jgi:cyclohexanone monooxygenase